MRSNRLRGLTAKFHHDMSKPFEQQPRYQALHSEFRGAIAALERRINPHSAASILADLL